MRATRAADATLDAMLVLLATWTLTYHLCLVAGWSTTVAVATELVLLALAAALVATARRSRSSEPGEPPRTSTPATAPRRSVTVFATTLAAGVAAVAMAASLPWVVVWVPFGVAATVGSVDAARRMRRAGDVPAPRAAVATGGPTAALALAWAVGLAVLSMVILRPNPDDLFYVNLSQWIAVNGAFPTRDTLFSDQLYPMANWPPTASYDALVGVVARLVGAHAATVAYVVVPPIATFLAVLALWRLLRAWRVRPVGVALSAALVFLLLDGTSSYASPGNLFLTRLWQGKVVLLCVVVPLLLVHALAYLDRPSRRGVAWLVACGASAVALSTTALFLVPVVALAAAAPLAVRGRRREALVLAGSMAAYPLAGALVTLVLGGRSADEFGSRRLYRFDPDWFGHQVFLTGGIALLGVAAVLLGCLLVPHPAARLTTGLLALATAVTFVPGATRLGYDLVGLGPTLWRISWGCTVGALVGVLAAETWRRLRPRVRFRGAGVVAGAVGLGVLAGVGHPIWAVSTSSTFVAPPSWKRGEGTRTTASWVIARSESGDVVLAPDALAVTIAVTTTHVLTVAPRDYYLDYLREDPSFHYPERLALVDFANQVRTLPPAELRRALRRLHVQIVCLDAGNGGGAAELVGLGWRTQTSTDTYRCLEHKVALT